MRHLLCSIYNGIDEISQSCKKCLLLSILMRPRQEPLDMMIDKATWT